MAIAEVTDQNFEAEVLNSDKPVIIDFWAEWCAPCRAMGPYVDKLAEEFDGHIKVVKLNTQDNTEVPARYGITAIVQPGGSVRDEEVVKAANEHGLAMVMTGMRHFRH